MVKRSSILGINILAVLPLASNASSAVSAAMIVPAIMARTASKYFCIVTSFLRQLRACEILAATLSFSDASEHENCRPPVRSEGHVALVYKADDASGIERIGIEDLLILLATRAAGRFITDP